MSVSGFAAQLMNIMSDDPESQIRLAAFAQGLQQLMSNDAKLVQRAACASPGRPEERRCIAT